MKRQNRLTYPRKTFCLITTSRSVRQALKQERGATRRTEKSVARTVGKATKYSCIPHAAAITVAIAAATCRNLTKSS